MPFKKVRTILETVSWTHQAVPGGMEDVYHPFMSMQKTRSAQIYKGNMVAFYDKWWIGKVNGNSSCNFYSTKAFGNAFPYILVAEKLWWDKQSFNWAEKRLQHWVPRQYSMAWGVTAGNETNTLGLESCLIFPPGWWSQMFPQKICWKIVWHTIQIQL